MYILFCPLAQSFFFFILYILCAYFLQVMFAFKCGAWADPRIPLLLDFGYLHLWFQNTRLLSVQFASEKHVCTHLSLQNDVVGIHFTIAWVHLPVASFLQQVILLRLQFFCFVPLTILWRLTFKDPLQNRGVMSFPCTLQQYSHCYVCFFIQSTCFFFISCSNSSTFSGHLSPFW